MTETECTVSDGSTTATIWVTKLDHNLDKPLIDIPLPRKNNGENKFEDEPTTYLIDIGRIKEIVTVQGMLYDTASVSALDMKDRLWELFKNRSKVTLTWGSRTTKTYAPETVTGNLTKVGVTETAGMIADGGQPEAEYSREKIYSVQLSLIVGEDKMEKNS